jgi:hypothetical protein
MESNSINMARRGVSVNRKRRKEIKMFMRDLHRRHHGWPSIVRGRKRLQVVKVKKQPSN